MEILSSRHDKAHAVVSECLQEVQHVLSGFCMSCPSSWKVQLFVADSTSAYSFHPVQLLSAFTSLPDVSHSRHVAHLEIEH